MLKKQVIVWIAKNKGELDVENISLFKTKAAAVRVWGKRQEIIPAVLSYKPPVKGK